MKIFKNLFILLLILCSILLGSCTAISEQDIKYVNPRIQTNVDKVNKTDAEKK